MPSSHQPHRTHGPHESHESHGPHRLQGPRRPQGPRRRGRVGGCLLAVLVAVTLWVGPSTPSTDVPTATGPGTTAAVSLSPTRAVATRRVSLAHARAWPRGVVTWSASVPTRYRWSVVHGIRAWNRTHSAVRFVERPASRARLRIRVGATGGATATATVGYQRGSNTVTLSRVAIASWRDRQVYGRVVAHELGHVLGLRHSRGLQCGLMEAQLDAACSPTPSKGRYACRWVEPAVGRLVVSRYGGTYAEGPRLCALRS